MATNWSTFSGVMSFGEIGSVRGEFVGDDAFFDVVLVR